MEGKLGRKFQIYQTYFTYEGRKYYLGDIHFTFLLNSDVGRGIERILEREIRDVQFFNPWAIATSDKDIVFMATPFNPIIYKDGALYFCSLENNKKVYCKEIEKDCLEGMFSIVKKQGFSIEYLFRKIFEDLDLGDKNTVYKIPKILGNYEMFSLGNFFQLFYKKVIGDYSKEDEEMRVLQIVKYSQTHFLIKDYFDNFIEDLLKTKIDFEELGIS